MIRAAPWCGALLALALAQPVRAAEPEDALEAPVVQGEAHATALTVDEAVAAALAGAPELLEAEARLEEARARRAQSAVLAGNPVVEGKVATTDGGFEIEARQPISVLGEGRHAHRAARSEIEAAEAALHRARLVAAAEARRAWLDAVASRRLGEIERRGAEVAVAMRDAVARQVELGEAPLLNLRLARLGAASAAADQLEAQREEAEALQRLSASVRRPLTAAAVPTGAPLTAPSPTRGAHDQRSDVSAARAAVAAAEAELARQRAAAFAPVELGAFVESDGETSHVGPAFELSLPLFDRNQAGRAQARGAVEVARARAEASAARATTEQGAARARVEAAETLATSLGPDLEAEALAALESIASGHALGELTLPDALTLREQVLDGLRSLVRLERELAEARLDLLLALEDEALLPR